MRGSYPKASAMFELSRHLFAKAQSSAMALDVDHRRENMREAQEERERAAAMTSEEREALDTEERDNMRKTARLIVDRVGCSECHAAAGIDCEGEAVTPHLSRRIAFARS